MKTYDIWKYGGHTYRLCPIAWTELEELRKLNTGMFEIQKKNAFKRWGIPTVLLL